MFVSLLTTTTLLGSLVVTPAVPANVGESIGKDGSKSQLCIVGTSVIYVVQVNHNGTWVTAGTFMDSQISHTTGALKKATALYNRLVAKFGKARVRLLTEYVA